MVFVRPESGTAAFGGNFPSAAFNIINNAIPKCIDKTGETAALGGGVSGEIEWLNGSTLKLDAGSTLIIGGSVDINLIVGSGSSITFQNGGLLQMNANAVFNVDCPINMSTNGSLVAESGSLVDLQSGSQINMNGKVETGITFAGGFAPTISQTGNPTSGSTFTISSQNATLIGGDLVLSSGSGVDNGNIHLQVAGSNVISTSSGEIIVGAPIQFNNPITLNTTILSPIVFDSSINDANITQVQKVGTGNAASLSIYPQNANIHGNGGNVFIFSGAGGSSSGANGSITLSTTLILPTSLSISDSGGVVQTVGINNFNLVQGNYTYSGAGTQTVYDWNQFGNGTLNTQQMVYQSWGMVYSTTNATGHTVETFSIPTDTSGALKVWWSAKNTSTFESATNQTFATYTNTAGSVTVAYGNVFTNNLDTGASLSGIQCLINASGGNLLIIIQGAASTNLDWQLFAEIQKN